MRTLAWLLLLLAGLSVPASADGTPSHDGVLQPNSGWIMGPSGNTVLLIEPIKDSFLDLALSDLCVPYDLFSGPNFSGVDLTSYEHVFVALDGPQVEAPSIAHVAAWAQAGGYLHFYGGTEYWPYALALDAYLLRNEVENYAWAESRRPHATIVKADHYLAAGLPASYDFEETEAASYQTRSIDSAVSVAARNGDGFDLLISKAIGQGIFDICINTPTDMFYWWPQDYAWGRQVIANMLTCGGFTPTESATWGSVKMLFR